MIRLLLLLFLALPCFAATWGPPQDRAASTNEIPWLNMSGVSGGIPNVTTIYTNLTPSGGSDTAQIQAALNACPSNQVVKLGNGMFQIGGTIDWSTGGNGRVLRGNGPTLTVLSFSSGYIYMRTIGSSAAISNRVNLTADAVKGETTISVDTTPSWLKVGELYIIDQLDDPLLIHNAGVEGGYSWAEQYHQGPRGLAQTAKLASITGSNLTFELPMYYGWKTSLTAQVSGTYYNAALGPSGFRSKKRCGIEDLKLHATQGYTANMVSMENCDECWIKNVESAYVPANCHVRTFMSYRVEVRDSYFHHSYGYLGGQGYGVALYNNSSACLVENNIFEHFHVSMQVNYGASGNVFGYNFQTNGYAWSGGPPAMNMHGTHAYMNLFEGNLCEDSFTGDWIHGSSSHAMLFRNRILGLEHNGPEGNPLYWDTGQLAVSLERYNRECSVVGNVLGVSGIHTNYQYCANTNCTIGPYVKTIYKIGYRNNWSASCSHDGIQDWDALQTNNVQRVYNWDAVTGYQDATNLPLSLYLSSQPTWWYASVPWPAIGPDLTPMTNKIPAQLRFETRQLPLWAPKIFLRGTYKAVAIDGR